MKLLAIACLGAALITQPTLATATPATNHPGSKPGSPTALVRKVQVEEFEKLSKDKQNILLDVRTPKEFEAGHIPGATNLDVNQPDFDQRVSALDRDKVHLVYCAAGVRSARACERMSRLGFRRLVDLAPGFKTWEKEGKKVEK
jgi:rhodanese-related sulfurtransferase